MIAEDMEKISTWFDQQIEALEASPVYPEIRERVEGLKNKVARIKREAVDAILPDDAL